MPEFGQNNNDAPEKMEQMELDAEAQNAPQDELIIREDSAPIANKANTNDEKVCLDNNNKSGSITILPPRNKGYEIVTGGNVSDDDQPEGKRKHAYSYEEDRTIAPDIFVSPRPNSQIIDEDAEPALQDNVITPIMGAGATLVKLTQQLLQDLKSKTASSWPGFHEAMSSRYTKLIAGGLVAGVAFLVFWKLYNRYNKPKFGSEGFANVEPVRVDRRPLQSRIPGAGASRFQDEIVCKDPEEDRSETALVQAEEDEEKEEPQLPHSPTLCDKQSQTRTEAPSSTEPLIFPLSPGTTSPRLVYSIKESHTTRHTMGPYNSPFVPIAVCSPEVNQASFPHFPAQVVPDTANQPNTPYHTQGYTTIHPIGACSPDELPHPRVPPTHANVGAQKRPYAPDPIQNDQQENVGKGMGPPFQPIRDQSREHHSSPTKVRTAHGSKQTVPSKRNAGGSMSSDSTQEFEYDSESIVSTQQGSTIQHVGMYQSHSSKHQSQSLDLQLHSGDSQSQSRLSDSHSHPPNPQSRSPDPLMHSSESYNEHSDKKYTDEGRLGRSEPLAARNTQTIYSPEVPYYPTQQISNMTTCTNLPLPYAMHPQLNGSCSTCPVYVVTGEAPVHTSPPVHLHASHMHQPLLYQHNLSANQARCHSSPCQAYNCACASIHVPPYRQLQQPVQLHQPAVSHQMLYGGQMNCAHQNLLGPNIPLGNGMHIMRAGQGALIPAREINTLTTNQPMHYTMGNHFLHSPADAMSMNTPTYYVQTAPLTVSYIYSPGACFSPGALQNPHDLYSKSFGFNCNSNMTQLPELTNQTSYNTDICSPAVSSIDSFNEISPDVTDDAKISSFKLKLSTSSSDQQDNNSKIIDLFLK